MKRLKFLIACGLVALPAFIVPAIGAQSASGAAALDASGNAADGSTAHRAALVQKLVGKWRSQVAETYQLEESVWVNDMAGTFAQVPIPTLELALKARTFDEMNAILVPPPGLLAGPAGSGSVQPKALGDIGTDLVFVPIAPCRIADTRLAGGQIATNTARHFDVTAVSDYSFQGGSATNCGGAGAAGSFAAGAFNFTVVTPPAAGYITAFPFLAAQPLAATVNYAAGDIRGNFAIVKLDQGASANELSIYAATATHLVIDMVGYFIQAPVPPLDCVETVSSNITVNANSTGTGSSPACAAGYTIVSGGCTMSTFDGRIVSSRQFPGSNTQFCAFRNENPTNSNTGVAYGRCCRLQGGP
ncbi:MAG: hypothetical protein IPJ28_14235 [Betaproteobacteria bacterium]|nr:hypothetical protein [Betaproteobacteria bacterium]